MCEYCVVSSKTTLKAKESNNVDSGGITESIEGAEADPNGVVESVDNSVYFPDIISS